MIFFNQSQHSLKSNFLLRVMYYLLLFNNWVCLNEALSLTRQNFHIIDLDISLFLYPNLLNEIETHTILFNSVQLLYGEWQIKRSFNSYKQRLNGLYDH